MTQCSRRRFRFSLKTALIVVVLLSVLSMWFSLEIRRAERQRQVVEAIRKVGGWVMYDHEISDVVQSKPEPFAAALLRELTGEDSFAVVVSVGFRFPKTVGDDDLQYLRHLTKLRTLELANTQITDAGLKHFEGLTRLEVLVLRDTRITDAGLGCLKELTDLGGLHLSRTQVTDAGVKHLRNLRKLQWINLVDTEVTDEGIKRLHKVLPKCEIIWDEEDAPRTDEKAVDQPHPQKADGLDSIE